MTFYIALPLHSPALFCILPTSTIALHVLFSNFLFLEFPTFQKRTWPIPLVVQFLFVELLLLSGTNYMNCTCNPNFLSTGYFLPQKKTKKKHTLNKLFRRITSVMNQCVHKLFHNGFFMYSTMPCNCSNSLFYQILAFL